MSAPPGYRIQGELSRGGQGVVYRALHEASGSPVALKLLLDAAPNKIPRFKQEARVLAALQHPHLPRVLGHGEHEGAPYLALEYVAGEDLAACVKRGGVPPLDWSARVLALVAHTLHHCHLSGVVHRDLKPSNIMIEAGTARPVLVDFGLVKRDSAQLHLDSIDAGPELSQSGSIKGTPQYMAPEQVNPSSFGPITPRTDVYALGATLYFLLTGEPPFSGRAAVVVMRKVTRKSPKDPRELNPAITEPLARVCLRCLEKQPADRLESAALVADALCAALGLDRIPPPPVAAPSERLDLEAEVVTTPAEPSPLRAPRGLPRIGDVFAGVRIERLLGRGGGGAVFAGRDAEGRPLALKLLLGDLSSEARRERFAREFEAGARLHHPGLIEIHSSGVERGLPYIVMELLEGAEQLDDYASARPFLERVELVAQAAEAAHAAHEQGLVHRDLKPQNVLVTPTGRVKVLDFGLARHLDKERMTMSGVVMGTVAYMAPEQVRGQSSQADARTDVYALGVVLYELLTGDLPYVGLNNLEMMAAILVDEAPVASAEVAGASPPLVAALRKAMAKDPAQRYPDAASLARDLRAISSGSGSGQAHAEAGRRQRARLLGGLVLAGLTLVVAGLGARQLASAPREPTAEERAALGDELLATCEDVLGRGQPLAAGAQDLERCEARLAEAGEGPPSLPLQHAAARLRAWRGLVELAAGQLEAARSRADPDDSDPVARALQASLALHEPKPDYARAANGLRRALRKRLQPLELRLWRSQALVEGGRAKTSRKDVEEDLATLEEAQAFPRERRSLALRLYLARGELEAAAALLERAPPPSPALRWRVGLERVTRAIDAPVEAWRAVAALPSPCPPELVSSALRAKVRRLLRERAEPSPLSAEAEAATTALFRLQRCLDPEPLPRDLRALLLARATAPTRPFAGWELAAALAEADPQDAAAQRAAGALCQRVRTHDGKAALLPALERAAAAETDPDTSMRVAAALELAFLADRGAPGAKAMARRCLLLVTDALLERVPAERVRSELLVARSRARRTLGQAAGALSDAQAAVELGGPSEHHWDVAQAALAQGEPEVAREAACRFLVEATSQDDALLRAMVMLWRDSNPSTRDVLRAALLRLLSKRPTLPGWWVRAALLQAEAGDAAGARRSLQEAARRLRGSTKESPKHLAQVEAALATDSVEALRAALGRAVEALERARGEGLYP
jgi:eukaryotic-like serine/threonine-protein kinase